MTTSTIDTAKESYDNFLKWVASKGYSKHEMIEHAIPATAISALGMSVPHKNAYQGDELLEKRRELITEWYGENFPCQTPEASTITLDTFLDSYSEKDIINLSPPRQSLYALSLTGRVLPMDPTNEDAYLYARRITSGSLRKDYMLELFGSRESMQAIDTALKLQGTTRASMREGREVTILNMDISVTIKRDRYHMQCPCGLGRYLYLLGTPAGDTSVHDFNVPEWIDARKALYYTAGIIDGGLHTENDGEAKIYLYKHHLHEASLKELVERTKELMKQAGIRLTPKGHSVWYRNSTVIYTINLSATKRELENILNVIPLKDPEAKSKIEELIERKKGVKGRKTSSEEVFAFLDSRPDATAKDISARFGITIGPAYAYRKRWKLARAEHD